MGQRYSLTMNESYYDAEKKKTVYIDYNGDGFGGNSLLYIPTEDELQKMDSRLKKTVRSLTSGSKATAMQRNIVSVRHA